MTVEFDLNRFPAIRVLNKYLPSFTEIDVLDPAERTNDVVLLINSCRFFMSFFHVLKNGGNHTFC